jgi:hypothetical protein
MDFEIEGERPCRFNVYRQIEVGLGDVSLEVAIRLSDKGELEVTQRLTNATDASVSFRCALYIPDQARLATQVINLHRGSDEKTYRLPNDKELSGKTLWLQAGEIGGPRILNAHFVVP